MTTLLTIRLAGLLMVAGVVPLQTPTDSRPNVLLIMADDLNDDMSTLGHPIVETPNIDRLAERGVTFTRAYTQFALCNPSRASLMTGLRPDTIEVYDLTTHFRETVPDVVTLPQAFRQAGYYTARVGKIYHYGNPGQIGTNGLDDAESWDHVVNPSGVDVAEAEHVTFVGPSRALGSSLAFYASPASDEEHTDGIVATEAIALMEAHRDGPFFIAAGFYKPHCPYIAPQQYFDMYPEPERIPATEFSELALRASPTASRGVVWDVPVEDQREAIRAYYATISFMDAQVGRLLDALDRLGLAENTIVVFLSDHGYHLGDHGGMWMKQSLFERSTRTPMIVAGAGVSAVGQVSGRIVELLDLYPTLVDLAGTTASERLEGRSLRPLLDDPRAAWEHAAFSQTRRPIAAALREPGRGGRGGGRGGNAPVDPQVGYSVRTERWRYIEWDEGRAGQELFDEFNDPGELQNLAGEPEYAGVVADLKARLAAAGRPSVRPVRRTGG